MSQWDIITELPADEAATVEVAPVTPHQLISNPEAADPAVLASLDTASFFDWRGIEGRIDLSPVIGEDVKALNMPPMSPVIVPHEKILLKLFEFFEPDLPAQDQHDPYYRARKIESCWFFPFGEKEFSAAEQRLKTGPWLTFVHNSGEAPQLQLTPLGQRRQFLELLRTRVSAGLDVYGRPKIDNGSL